MKGAFERVVSDTAAEQPQPASIPTQTEIFLRTQTERGSFALKQSGVPSHSNRVRIEASIPTQTEPSAPKQLRARNVVASNIQAESIMTRINQAESMTTGIGQAEWDRS